MSSRGTGGTGAVRSLTSHSRRMNQWAAAVHRICSLMRSSSLYARLGLCRLFGYGPSMKTRAVFALSTAGRFTPGLPLARGLEGPGAIEFLHTALEQESS
jgi:hypothetical protein